MVTSLTWNKGHHQTLHNIKHLDDMRSGGDSGVPQKMFPRLRCLIWHETTPEWSPLAQLFIGPRTSNVAICYEEPAGTITGAILGLRRLCLLLGQFDSLEVNPTTLNISITGLLRDGGGAAYRVQTYEMNLYLQDFIHKRGAILTGLNVSLGSPVPDLFVAGSGAQILARLSSLTLEICDPEPFGQMVLPALRSLELNFNTPTRNCIDFARTLSCPRLDHLTLSFGVSGIWQDHMLQGQLPDGLYLNLPKCIYEQGIREADYYKTVTSFSLRYHTGNGGVDPREWDRIAQEAEWRFVHCLLTQPFPQVQSLSISTTRFQTTALWFINTLPAAYPRLHTLALTRPPEHCAIGMFQGMDFSAIRTLVARLPELRHLTTWFSNWGIHKERSGYFDEHAKEWIPHRTKLRSWNVLESNVGQYIYFTSDVPGYWKPKHLRKTGDRLHKAFPLLDTVECSESDRLSPRWADVTRYLRTLS